MGEWERGGLQAKNALKLVLLPPNFDLVKLFDAVAYATSLWAQFVHADLIGFALSFVCPSHAVLFAVFAHGRAHSTSQRTL